MAVQQQHITITKGVIKMKLKIIRIIVLALFLVACSPQINKETVKVGWVGPLSGDGGSFGQDNFLGVEAAVDTLNKQGGINGKHVQLLVEDDQLDETMMINTYQKFTKIDNVDVILSPDYGGLLSVVAQADQDQVVIVNSLDTSDELAESGEYLFAVGIHDENIGYALAEFANQYDNIAVIYNLDPLTSLIESAFEDKYEGNLIIAEGYTFETTDFRTPLLKVEDADAIVVIGFDETGFIFKQMKQLGMTQTKIAMDTVTSEAFLANAGEAAEGIYFSSWDATGDDYQALAKRMSRTPDQPLFTAAGYDAMMFVAKAMSTGTNLHNSMYTTQMQGVTGELTMSPDGIVRTVSEEMYQVQNGKFVKLS